MSGPRCTVIGASGFIGRHLVASLERGGAEVLAPPRGSSLVFEEDLGHVFYCAGLTADWRRRPLDAVHAHVGHLVDVLERARFASLLYLSSTRVYKRAAAAVEDALLSALPAEPDDLFDLSKMLGEAACLADTRHGGATRVARLSNVYGPDYLSDNFLSSILRDAVRGHVVLRTSRASEKDYVGVEEVVALLPRIATSGRERVYNVASGVNTQNGALLDEIVRLTGCTLEVAAGAPTTTFPVISIDRIRRELDFTARPVSTALAGLVDAFRRQRQLWERP
jgi:nucleoside-diphosphate-sugar epimerase